MQVSYQWLQKYVSVPWSPEALAERMTLSGIEVEGVAERGRRLSGVFTGKITALSPHPNADKLQVCQLEMGQLCAPLLIVTGANNVFVGAVVPVAMDGAKLPIGKDIGTADFRGVLSQGMLCGGDEMGLEKKIIPPEMRDGIYILPADAPLGVDVKEVLGLSDHVLELGLTPNRSDCLSMLGTAYEVAALAEQTVQLPELHRLERIQQHSVMQVSVVDQDLCPGYFGLVVEDVQIGPSPLWMQNALQAAGLRPINNLVDITNYILLELGQPLHAFDLDQLHGQQILVRRALPGEQIVTLDDSTRELSPEMLVIADQDRAVGIAGVMGGAETEVTAVTRRVFLESAWFQPQSIRRTSRDLGLRTDASSRFDKGVDPARVLMALERAAYLISKLNCGRPDSVMVGEMMPVEFEQRISLRPSRVNHLLGTDIPEGEMRSIFDRLGLVTDDSVLPWQVTAPSRRPDLVDEIDLVEEVARLHGYDRIPTSSMTGPVMQGYMTKVQRMVQGLRQGALAQGLNEVVNMSFINPQSIADLVGANHPWNNALRLQNPLTSERSVMRPSLLFGLLDVLAYNGARQQTDLEIFELANVFTPQSGETLRQPVEPLHLAIASVGQFSAGWQTSPLERDFFHVKGLVERILLPYGVDRLRYQASAEFPFLHPGRSAEIFWGDSCIGFLGEVHPDSREQYGLRKRVIVAELNLDPLLKQADYVPLFQGLPRFPAVERDLAVIVDEAVPSERVAACIRAAGGELLVDLRLFDIYQGGQVPAGKKSLAYSLVLRSQERTLQEEEIAGVHSKVLGHLAKELGALLR